MISNTHEKSFIYLRYNWISTSTKLLAIASSLAEECRRARSTQRQVLTDYSTAFNVVLASLEISGAYEHEQWIRIVTDSEVYGGKTKRSAAHNRQILIALEWLISGGYLLKVDGKRTYKHKDSSQIDYLPFAYVVSDKWRDEISMHPMSLQHEIVRNPLGTYVQLRTKIKGAAKGKMRSVSLQITGSHRQAYPDLISGTERLLEAADNVWRNINISLSDNSIPPMYASMTRIFNNGNFDEGGRFYCQLQNLPKEQRKQLRFNDEPTIEIDFSGLHPHLIYHLNGDNFKDDPYVIEGYKREVVKVAFNTMLNRSADKHKGSAANSLANNIDISTTEAEALVDAVYKLHHRIADKFNTGFGLHLQKIDSQIAYEVMKHFFIDLGRPVLMIHDSAIVNVRDVETLMIAMVDAYRLIVSEALRLRHRDIDFAPLPHMMNVSSEDFNGTLKDIIYKALEGKDIHSNEWSIAIKQHSLATISPPPCL